MVRFLDVCKLPEESVITQGQPESSGSARGQDNQQRQQQGRGQQGQQGQGQQGQQGQGQQGR